MTDVREPSDADLPDDDSLLDDLTEVDAEAGPYGDEVVAETAARERRAGRVRGGDGTGTTGSGMRPTRRGWVAMGAAAGVIAVLGVVGATSLRSSGTAASSPASNSLSAGSPSGSAGSPSIHIEMSGRAYTIATLATAAQALLDAPGPALGQPAVESPSIGPIGTPVGMRSCLDTLGESDAERVAADIALVDGQPAAVIVVVDEGLKQVYVVGRACTKGDPAIISGPLPMN